MPDTYTHIYTIHNQAEPHNYLSCQGFIVIVLNNNKSSGLANKMYSNIHIYTINMIRLQGCQIQQKNLDFYKSKSQVKPSQ